MKLFLSLFILANTLFLCGSPPKGFTALFNGKNLDGWWGLKTEDPDKWMALSAEELKVKWEASQIDIKKH